MASNAHAHDDHAGPHISPMSMYISVYLTLLVLTIVTVGVSYLGLPGTPSLIVAMGVALVKATLVAAFFMHLAWDARFNIFIFVAAFWFAASFFTFVFIDLSSRGAIIKSQDNFEYRQDIADGLPK
ncbi:MAG: cytochrome c oxidase subunit 4 [Myxococcota bacterium]|jgi:cytochrome c oxidase subunit 4